MQASEMAILHLARAQAYLRMFFLPVDTLSVNFPLASFLYFYYCGNIVTVRRI
jgi:hypothetical protein